MYENQFPTHSISRKMTIYTFKYVIIFILIILFLGYISRTYVSANSTKGISNDLVIYQTLLISELYPGIRKELDYEKLLSVMEILRFDIFEVDPDKSSDETLRAKLLKVLSSEEVDAIEGIRAKAAISDVRSSLEILPFVSKLDMPYELKISILELAAREFSSYLDSNQQPMSSEQFYSKFMQWNDCIKCNNSEQLFEYLGDHFKTILAIYNKGK